MSLDIPLDRRRLLTRTLQAAALFALAGCDGLSSQEGVHRVFGKTERLTDLVQRAITPRQAMAKEYREADLSAIFPANGTQTRTTGITMRSRRTASGTGLSR